MTSIPTRVGERYLCFIVKREDRGWGGPYGQHRRPIVLVCEDCGIKVHGSSPWELKLMADHHDRRRQDRARVREEHDHPGVRMTTARVTENPPTPDDRCGTRRGYQAHRKRGEYACGPCLAANAASKREYVTEHGMSEMSIQRDKARLRAQTRLAEMHPDEFAALFAEEMSRPTARAAVDAAKTAAREAATNAEETP